MTLAEAVKPDTRPRIEFPEKLVPLMERQNRKRYYVAYGGRASGKSWSFARALCFQMIREPLRVLCAREVMRTISESVHQLLADQIRALNMGDYYTVLDAEIRSKVNDAQVVYAGLRTMDANKIRSYEGVDICWIEEAHTVRKKSWEILIPTVRAERSEIWVTFNPDLDSDDTYVRFVEDPPENAFSVKMTYRDNPWFPEVLEQERRDLLRRDPLEYDNIWEGNPRSVVEGAIYAKELRQMVEEHRFGSVPYIPGKPVHRVWDLGWNDMMAIIFVQKTHAAASIIGYHQGSFKRYDEWISDFNKMPYVWGEDWLPHDGKTREPRTGKSAKEWLEGLGCKHVRLIRQHGLEDGIKQTRMLFPRLYIDKRNANELMTSLKRYRRNVPETTGEPGAPVHDENSHGADALRALAQCVDKVRNDLGYRANQRVDVFVPFDPGAGY